MFAIGPVMLRQSPIIFLLPLQFFDNWNIELRYARIIALINKGTLSANNKLCGT